MTHTEPAIRVPRHGAALCAVLSALCWSWVLLGSGTGMSVRAMTTWAYPPSQGVMAMPATWGAGYAALMLVMWVAMMLAMMLPGLLAEMISDERPGLVSVRFVTEYASVWVLFSLGATALQYVAEAAGLLDGMRMWSADGSFSVVLLFGAVSSQVVQAARNRFGPEARGTISRSGLTHGFACLRRTGPMMMLLFVGGLMNLVWMGALTAWVVTQKMWPRSELHPISGALVCGVLIAATLLG